MQCKSAVSYSWSQITESEAHAERVISRINYGVVMNVAVITQADRRFSGRALEDVDGH